MRRTRILTVTFIFSLFASSAPCFGGHISFETHVVTLTAQGVRGVSLADVDGDGDLDLMSADSGDNKVVWYENNGAISPEFTTHIIGTGRRDGSFLLGADMNNDSTMDIISSSITDDKIAYYQNDGLISPSFTEQVITIDPDLTTPDINGFVDAVRMISVGDLDGDGDMDVASSSASDDKIAWFENQGATWVEHTLSDMIGGARAVWIDDLDQDGDMDVIGGPWYGQDMTWYENDGNLDVGFTEHVLMHFPLHPTPLPNIEEAGMIWRIQTADMDGDGDTDVIAARRAGGAVEWYENDGEELPQFTRHTIDDTFGGGKSVFPADLDNDGDMDIVIAGRADDRISWYANDGEDDPSFEEHILHIDPDGPGGAQGFVDGARSVFVGDIDGDTDLDILWGGLSGHIVGWEENLMIQLPEPGVLTELLIDSPHIPLDFTDLEIGVGAEVNVTPGYSQAPASIESVLAVTHSGTRTGTFANEGQHLRDGLFVEAITYNANDITVDIMQAIPGDLDGDGTVTISIPQTFPLPNLPGDALIMIPNIGITSGAEWTDGDFDGDGAVTISIPQPFPLPALEGDARILLNNLGQSVTPDSAAVGTAHLHYNPATGEVTFSIGAGITDLFINSVNAVKPIGGMVSFGDSLVVNDPTDATWLSVGGFSSGDHYAGFVLQPGLTPFDGLTGDFVFFYNGSNLGQIIIDTPDVPEPASLVLMILGLAGLVACGRRRRSE